MYPSDHTHFSSQFSCSTFISQVPEWSCEFQFSCSTLISQILLPRITHNVCSVLGMIVLCSTLLVNGWYLHTASQHSMEHVSTPFHQSNVSWCRVQVLAVSDGVHKPVTELFASTEQVQLHKTHHAVICTYIHTRTNTCVIASVTCRPWHIT